MVYEKLDPIILFYSDYIYWPGPGLSIVFLEKSILFTLLKKLDDAATYF